MQASAWRSTTKTSPCSATDEPARQQRTQSLACLAGAGGYGARARGTSARDDRRGAHAGAHRSRRHRHDRDRYAERFLPRARLARRHRGRCGARARADREVAPAASRPARARRADRLGELGQPAGPAEPQPLVAARLRSARHGCRAGRRTRAGRLARVGIRRLECGDRGRARTRAGRYPRGQIPDVGVLGHAARQYPAEPARRHAAVRRGQCRPVRDVDATGREFPGLRLRARR